MVPEDWQLTTFENHIDLLSGFPFKSNGYTDNEADVRLLRGDNIEPGRVRWRNSKRWPADEYTNLKKYHLKVGDLVIAMDRTFVSAGLKVAEVKFGDTPSMLVQRVSRVRAKDALDQRLLRQYFSGHKFEQYVKAVQTETAVPHISAKQIKDFPVALPPMVEQSKIADVLAVWEQAIETAGNLIENSKAQKKALMQQLLTGKKRLPGFSDKWQEYCLGELGTTYGGLSGKSKSDFGKGYPYVPYLNVFRNSAVDPCTTDLVDISTNENQNAIQYGDILFTTSSETPEEVGMSSVVLHHPPVTFLNSFCFGFRPHTPETLAPEFARFLFRGTEFRLNITRLAQGSTRFNLSKRYLLKVKMSLPPINEQLAIARVLSLAEQEVRAQYLQLVDLRMEKRSLMQQLLTGKRRVKVAA